MYFWSGVWVGCMILGMKRVNQCFHFRPLPESSILKALCFIIMAWLIAIGFKMNCDSDLMLTVWIEDQDNYLYLLTAIILAVLKFIYDVTTNKIPISDAANQRHRKRNTTITMNPFTTFFMIILGLPFFFSFLPYNFNAPVFHLDFLSVEEVDFILNKTLKYAETHDFAPDLTENLPTNDVKVKKIPVLHKWLVKKIKKYYEPFLKCKFSATDYDIDGLTVIRYMPSVQAKIVPHFDDAEVTLNVMLSNKQDYEGGGTRIAPVNNTLFQIEKGEALTHSCNMRHAGEGVTKGIRYILVGNFWIYQDSNWDFRALTYMRGLFTWNPKVHRLSKDKDADNYYLNNCGLGFY